MTRSLLLHELSLEWVWDLRPNSPTNSSFHWARLWRTILFLKEMKRGRRSSLTQSLLISLQKRKTRNLQLESLLEGKVLRSWKTEHHPKRLSERCLHVPNPSSLHPRLRRTATLLCQKGPSRTMARSQLLCHQHLNLINTKWCTTNTTTLPLQIDPIQMWDGLSILTNPTTNKTFRITTWWLVLSHTLESLQFRVVSQGMRTCLT